MPDDTGTFTPTLCEAADKGSDEDVERLCAGGAEVNAFGDHALPEGVYSMTPLMLAALKGHHTTVETLLTHGAIADLCHPKTRRTALHEACCTQSPHCIRLLAESSQGKRRSAEAELAQVRKRLTLESVGRQQPIHVAAESGAWEVVEYLCAVLGSDELLTACKGGWVAAHFAASAGHPRCLASIFRLGGPDALSVVDKHGRTPTHTAARQGRVECLTLLPPESLLAKDSTSKNALHCAAYEGHVDVLRFAVQHLGSECLSSRDATGQNVAHYAAKRHSGDSSLVLFLRDAQERKTNEEGGETIFTAANSKGESPEALLRVAQCNAGGEFRVSNVRAKRWQRSVFITGTAMVSQSTDTATCCLLLDDCASGARDPFQSHLTPDWAHVPWGSLCDTTTTPFRTFESLVPTGEHLSPRALCPSTAASCSGDLLRCCVVKDPKHIFVANPDIDSAQALEDEAGVYVFRETSTTVLRAVAKRSKGGGESMTVPQMRGVWLDYCNGIDSDTNREDVDLVFSSGVLFDRACVCFTYSWRGVHIHRTGRPKQGDAHLAQFASDIDTSICTTARAHGYSLKRLEPATQCGQLFFLSYVTEKNATPNKAA